MRRGRQPMELPWASFADALTGMLFVFLITTFWFAAESFRAKAAFEEAKVETLGVGELARKLERELVTSADEGAGQRDLRFSLVDCLDAKVGLRPGQPIRALGEPSEVRVSLYLGSTVETIEWFRSESSTLEAPQQQAVQRVHDCLAELSGLLGDGPLGRFDLSVFIEGHTDTRGDYNWELSGRRAATVLKAILAVDAASTTAPIGRATEAESLALFAVGMADQRPAWGRICEEAARPDPAPGLVDDLDDRVCEALGQAETRGRKITSVEVQRALAEAALYARSVSCGPVPDDVAPIDEMPVSSLFIRWANRCPNEAPAGRAADRQGLLRRVDLRLKLTPRLDGSEAP